MKLTNIWKNAHYHWSLEKCKSKLHWDTISCQLEWQSLKNLKKCSLSLVIREMQIKTTLRYNLMPVRMTIIKKSGDNRCWRGCGEIGTLLHGWWERKLVQPLWKTVWRFLKYLEIEIPFDSAIPLLGIYPKTINHSTIKTHAHICLLQHCVQ